MKKLRARTTLGSLAAAGAAVGLIFLVAEISLLVAGRISRQAVLEDLAETSRRNAVLFSLRLAMALGDMALLNNAAEGRGQASRESIQRAMRSLQALRGTYAGAALFDRKGSEVFSTGAVPRSLAGGGEAASRWMALLRELPENEVLAFPERLAAAPVLVLAMRVGSAQSGDVAVFVAPAEKLLADAPLPPDEHFLILRTESGDQYELDASGRIIPAASIPVPPSGGKTRGEASESAEFLAAWQGLLIEPDPSLPQGSLHFSRKSHTGWSLAAVRSTASLRQQMAGIEAGIRILASVLALITAPLAFAGTSAYLRLSVLRRQLNQILEASPVGILAVRAEENSENLRLELANPAAVAILTPPGTNPSPEPNLPPRLDSLLRQTIGSNLPSTAEIQLFEAPERWVAVRAAPAEGSAVITLADTTERRRQEEALQSSEQSLQLAARMAKIGVWRVDFDPPGIWWSPEVRRIHAVPDDYEPDLESAFAFYPPESRARLRELFNRSVETGEEFDGEFDFRDARGRVVWVRVIGQAERDPSTGKTIRVHGTFQDITETHESAIALAESREMLSVAFWGASLSVSDCRFDTGEFIFDANLLRLLGYEKREVVPTLKFRDSLMPEADRRRWAESLEACFEGRTQLFECEYRLAAKDGSFRWLLERSKIVSVDTSNRPERMVGIITDITRLKEAEELAASALEHEKDLARKAQAASEAKKDFLAMMSHEIRTPLNSVLGFAEMLAGRPLDSESAEYVATIRESGESLLRILNDILDYSRIESGKLQIEERSYNPRSVLRSVVDLLKPIALSKGIELAASVSEDVPEAVLGDEVRVKQVLVNLAGNAVKFTSKGGVNLRLHIEEDGRNLVFSVRDTGPGIAAAKLESIFEPFTQADASISRAHGGTGLGLAISSQLVHLMDGTIWAESTLGEGSEFAFSIPLRAAPAEASLPASDVLVPGEASFAKNLPLRILIAEDDRVNARLTRLILNRLGYSPAIVHDGRKAVEAAASDPPDLILMDLRMPNMDGLEATRAIRAIEAGQSSRPRIFIAALTADVLPEGRDQSFDAGMDHYITKPVSSAKILEVLRKAALQKNPAAPA